MGSLADAAEKIQKARSLNDSDPQLKKLERRLAVAKAKHRISDALGQFGP